MISFSLIVVISNNPFAVFYVDQGILNTIRLCFRFLYFQNFDFYYIALFVNSFCFNRALAFILGILYHILKKSSSNVIYYNGKLFS